MILVLTEGSRIFVAIVLTSFGMGEVRDIKEVGLQIFMGRTNQRRTKNNLRGEFLGWCWLGQYNAPFSPMGRLVSHH